ncbi:c-type cytochrome [Desulfuromonas versatilis]|uniref:C-type cytochrome n=1 Tax=Desulfuromonas versatilis TaxID=2802975 RepID=A0ABN6DWB7_9BACT|nr:c-type cytochrome domain-containing protein [Desulfuromonas versatilis]BCR04433.1 c-type cytochrome [Desulfuromonas versatilis]
MKKVPAGHRLLLIASFLALLTAPAIAADPTWDDVSMILQQRCVVCHQGPAAPKGLRLDSLDGLRAGSEDGPVALPEKPAESELLKRVRGKSLPRMPLTGPPWLNDEEIDLIERWVAAGMPAAAAAAAATPGSAAIETTPEPSTVTSNSPRWSNVAPIFLSRCAKCHSPTGMMGPAPEGFLTTGYAEILASGERARIVPGQPGASEVVRRIKGLSRPRMPFDGPPWLDDDQIDLIEKWIAADAPDDQGQPAPIPVGARVRFEGTLTERWKVDGQPLAVGSGTRLDKDPGVGAHVQVQGIVEQNGTIRATRIRGR